MVNATKQKLSPLPGGNYGQSTKQSTSRCHQANEGTSGFEVESGLALGALCNLRSKKNLSAEKWQEIHLSSNEEKEKWIEDYVDRETAVGRKQGHNSATAITQELREMTIAQHAEVTPRKPETMFEAMLNAIGDSLSDLASSDDEHDGEDEEDDKEDTELDKLSDDDEPGWVMGTISKTVQYRMDSFWQKQMRVDELTQPG